MINSANKLDDALKDISDTDASDEEIAELKHVVKSILKRIATIEKNAARPEPSDQDGATTHTSTAVPGAGQSGGDAKKGPVLH